MRKTIQANHPAGAKEVQHPQERVTYPMCHGETHYWECGDNLYAEQSFDGRYTYIYYYEFWIHKPMTLSFSSLAPDLHLCYPLKCESDHFFLSENDSEHHIKFQHELAFYLYLPTIAIALVLPVGHHIIMGLTLDAGLFRPNRERVFDFVMPLVLAKRAGHTAIMQSITYKFGPLTYCEIHNLFRQISPKDMANEHLLIHHQIYMISLSRFKIMKETTKTDIVENARDYLQLTVSKFGAHTRISDIAKSLKVNPDKLGRLHQEYHQCSLQEYRNELLLERIISLLDAYPNQFAVLAEKLNFTGHTELNRFFRRMTGHSLSQYKNQS